MFIFIKKQPFLLFNIFFLLLNGSVNAQLNYTIISSSCDDTVKAPETYHERYNNDSIIYLKVKNIDSSNLNEQLIQTDSCYVKIKLHDKSIPELDRIYPYSIFNGKFSDGAYSVRRLTHHYTGYLMTIKAKGKSISQSIGYLADGTLDTTLIKSYCGTDSCFVEKWFDQSGWGRHATQDNQSQQPLICNNGKIYRFNGVPTLYYYSSANKKPVYLKTEPYNMRLSRQAFGYFKDVLSKVSLFIAGGVKEDLPQAETFVSKTAQNQPNTWDTYDGSLLVSGLSPPHTSIDQVDMFIPFNGPKSFNIWTFTFESLLHSYKPGHFKAYSYFNSRINSAKVSGSPSFSFFHNLTNSGLFIGSRDDEVTALNGWISEVWVFPYFMGPDAEGVNYLDNTVRLLNADMSAYYNIGQLHDIVNVTNEHYLNHTGLTEAQQSKLVAAYSLRKLSDGYNGPAVRVSRKSDGKQADIFFDSELNISNLSQAINQTQDSGTLSGFCQSTECYISRWYNQGGRDSLYLFQKNEKDRPLLFENGNVVTINGRPTIYFDSTQYGPNYLETGRFVGFPPIQYGGTWNRPMVRFDTYVAGGVKKNTLNNTFFSKTNNAVQQTRPLKYKNLPGPFDTNNDLFSIGNGNISYWTWDCLSKANLINSIDASIGFNIWHFFSKPNNNFLNAANYYAAPYSNINFSNNSNLIWPVQSTNMNDYPLSADAGEPLMVGTRLDSATSLNGWISELYFFNNSPSEEQGRYTNLTTNMLGYYNIGNTGNCLDFDPIKNNYVEIGPSTGLYTPGSSYTKEAWIFWTGENGNRQIISSQDIFSLGDGKLFVENARFSNMNSGNMKSENPITKNTWTHVAVTYDSASNSYALYVNGDPVKGAVSGTPRNSTSTQTYIGKHPSQDNYYFDGKIDEVRIWNIVRSAQQIKDNYNSIINKGPGLVAYYNFDQGDPGGNNSSTTKLVNNVSPIASDYNGSLVNFSLEGIISNWVKSGVPIK